MSFTYFLRFVPRYLIFFQPIANGIVSTLLPSPILIFCVLLDLFYLQDLPLHFLYELLDFPTPSLLQPSSILLSLYHFHFLNFPSHFFQPYICCFVVVTQVLIF